MSARTAAKVAGLALGSLALVFLLAEFVVLRGIMGFHGTREVQEVFQHDPTVGWRFRPGASGIHSALGFRVHYAINSRGFRNLERPAAKDSGVVRVLTLGDSFTEGFGVEPEETYSRQLDSLLSTRIGKRV